MARNRTVHRSIPRREDRGVVKEAVQQNLRGLPSALPDHALGW